MAKIKLVLFGGTFDPIHIGHTTVASQAAEHIGADKVVLIPAKRSPLKNFLPEASNSDRFEMLSLAISGFQKFSVSDYELTKSEPNYTLDTVRKFQADYHGNALIYWLAGADNIDELARWYRISELIDECNLSIMYRAGCKLPDFRCFEAIWGAERVEKLKQNVIATSLIDISSTEIRKRLADGLDVDDMVASAVAEYIREHGLYR